MDSLEITRYMIFLSNPTTPIYYLHVIFVGSRVGLLINLYEKFLGKKIVAVLIPIILHAQLIIVYW